MGERRVALELREPNVGRGAEDAGIGPADTFLMALPAD
jgi:hypothetical protein